MKPAKALLTGACVGILMLGGIGVLSWHYFLADDGPLVLSQKWYVSSPASLNREVISNDVWIFPDSSQIEPVQIQRVEWHNPSLIGRDSWGYFLYYKSRVTDAKLSMELRESASDTLSPLPAWATHRPSWWTPQQSVPNAKLSSLDLQSPHIFFESVADTVFIYWIRAPFTPSRHRQ